MKNNYREIISLEQLRNARRELDEQLQNADRECVGHWNSLLDRLEPVNIAAKVANRIFDIVSQAAMVERIYRTLQSFLHTIFDDDKEQNGV